MVVCIYSSIPDFFVGLFAFVASGLLGLKVGLKPVVQAIDAREKKIASQLIRPKKPIARLPNCKLTLTSSLPVLKQDC